MTLQIEEIKLDYNSEKIYVGDSIDVSIVSDNQDIEYAWYVMNGKERVEIKWYKKDQQSITYTFSTPGNYRFIGYIKDKGNNKKSLTSNVLKINKQQISDLKNISLTENDFENELFNEQEPVIYSVTTAKLQYDLLFKRDFKSSKLTVLGTGATKLKPPVFNRFSWMNEIEGNVLYYSDPTCKIADIRTGYYLGVPSEFALQKIAEFIRKIAKKINVSNENIMLFGTSAGGFASLILGGMLENTTVFINNPVTASWKSVYFKSMLERLHKENAEYQNFNFEKIKEEYIERVDAIEFFKKSKFVPNIYYLQNAACKYDMKARFLPFITKYEQLSKKRVDNKLIIEFYWDEVAQHNPVNKAQTLEYIHQMHTRFKKS